MQTAALAARTSASGRLQPPKFLRVSPGERPLSAKADVQQSVVWNLPLRPGPSLRFFPRDISIPPSGVPNSP